MSIEAQVYSWMWISLGPAALIAARASGLAATAPGWGTQGLDWRARLGLVGLLTVLLMPVVGPGLPAGLGPAALARGCLVELAVGAALGASAALVMAAARQAGEIVGIQAGLSPASLLDPEAGDGLTPLGHLYGLVALGVFLALDGPLKLVAALVESYRAVPAGGLMLSHDTASKAFGRVGWALGLSLRAAAPAALALAFAGLALGLLARTSSALQLMGLAPSIRSAAGLLLVILGLAALVATLSAAWSSMF